MAKTYWTCIQQEKYSEAVGLYYNIDELFSDDGKELLASLMKVEMSIYGKITKVKILSVDKENKPDHATVTVQITTEDSTEPHTESMDVVKSNGKWYIDFDL